MWDCEGLGCKTANLLESHPGMRRAPSPQLILPMLPTCKSSLVLSSTWHDAKRMTFTAVLEIQSSTHCPVEASVGNSDVPLHNSPSAFIHRWSSCQKGISTTDFPIPYFWSIQLFIPLLWISVVGEGIRKEVFSGWWPKSSTKNQQCWQGWHFSNVNWPQRENEESQGKAFLKLLQVPSCWTLYTSSEQALVRQVCDLELHWGPLARPDSTEAILASLPHQLSDPQKPAEACIDLMGKITTRASPLLETCTCTVAQPNPPQRKGDKTTAVGERT